MDFEFNLDELDNSDDLNLDDHFVFNQFGGSEDEGNESRLPGEELMDEPKEQVNAPGTEKNTKPEQIEIELVGNNDADAGEKREENQPANNATANSNESKPVPVDSDEEEDEGDTNNRINFQDLISKTQSGETVAPPLEAVELEAVELEADREKGQPVTAPVVVESEELDESAGEPQMDTVETYLKKIKATLDEDIDSVEIEGLDVLMSNNKMNSPEYHKYLKSLKKYFSDMKTKKKSNYEFSRGKDGSYIKKNSETGEEINIKPPIYTNIKQILIDNKFNINGLLFRLDKIKRDMIAGDYKVHSKLGGEYDEKMTKLRDFLKLNREYSELISGIESTDKLITTNENIANMKINQVSNYSRIKELINKKGDMGDKVDEIINYLNVNNSILKSYGKTRKYYGIDESEYFFTNNLPKETKKKGSDEELDEDSERADPSAWNPESPKFSPHSPEEPPADLSYSPHSPEEPPADLPFSPHSPDGPPPEDLSYSPHSPHGPPPDDLPFSPHSPEEPPPDDLPFSPHSPEEPPEDLREAPIETEREVRKKAFYSKFTKGQIHNPDELLEGVSKQVKPAAEENLDIEELSLDDDLEALQPEYAAIPEGDDDEEEDLDDYRYNDSSKLNAKKRAEMELAKAQDKALPINLEESGESGGEEADEDAGAMSKKELQKISRQLNKPVDDENVKVIEIDGDLSFKPKKCDDSKTKRSTVKTTNVAKGRKRKQKEIDPELKNCIFPFKTVKGRGKKKEETYHNECLDNGVAPMCATERTEDCRVKKWAYCKTDEEEV